jgi:uncharacterized membrane protein (DUF2068 family)
MLPPALKIDSPRGQKNVLRAVASVELIKGIFVLALGIVAILLLHKDTWVIAESILALLHVNTDRRSAQMFLDFADDLTDARLWAAAGMAFGYSVLRFAEGYGLWNQRVWAEWLAFGSGTLFLPLEIRALLHGVTTIRVMFLVVNLGVIGYMFLLLRAGHRERQRMKSAEPGSRHSSGI